jgi:CheY-like chemotaxis protein
MSRVGEDGVTLALDLRPDLLVLNVPLPDMTWAEAVRRVRALDGLALVPSLSSPPSDSIQLTQRIGGRRSQTVPDERSRHGSRSCLRPAVRERRRS